MSDWEDDDCQAFVIDNGSCLCKAGFAGDDAPRATFSSVMGKPRHHRIMVGIGNKDGYIGDEAQAKRAVLSLEYPIKRGVVTDWDSMLQIWEYMFYNQVRAAPEEHPVLITEPPLNGKINREKMTEIFMEKLEVPGFYVALPAILAIYASGRGSAICMDIGDGVSHVVPVYEGYTIPSAIDRLNLGGQDVTDYMNRLIQSYSLDTTAERESVRELKEKLCYTSEDYYKELSESELFSADRTRYELPDGNTVSVGTEKFRGPEALFQPHLIGLDYPGVHDLLYGVLTKCDMDMKKDLYCSIVVSGGPTMCQGFPERLQKELQKLIPAGMRVKVVAAPERKYSVWIGGSILASLSTFQSMWITKAEYDEHGPVIVHKKCF